MKKRLYIISALFLLLASSCTNELEITKNEGKLSFSSINASMADLPTSRTHLENGGRVVWDVNDQVGIFSDTQIEPVQFTCTSVDDSKASFTSNDEVSGNNFIAFYPYEDCKIEGNELTYTLSSNTQYTEGTYFRQCPMIAKSNTNEFKFKHTCGIIRFSITGTQQIYNLTLEGNNNEVIAGTGIIDVNKDMPVFSIPADAIDASTTVTMFVGLRETTTTITDFYFVVPQIEFTNGISLIIDYWDENGVTKRIEKSTSKHVSVSRSTIKSFSVIDTDELIQEKKDEIFNALMTLYNATNGDNWKNNTNWGSDKPFNEWYGISGEEVVDLTLEENNLNGYIPKEITALKKLKFLSFSGNQIDSIHDCWGEMRQLEWLFIERCNLTGEIPQSITQLPKIKRLSFNNNNLGGEIPKLIGNLSFIEELRLGSNNLIGEIPKELGQNQFLKILELCDNKLSGNIPQELTELSCLEFLQLGYNEMTGEIPEYIGNFPALEELHLYNNHFTGEIPKEMGNIKTLKYLHLADNSLIGVIPKEISNLTNLETLSLASNQLEGGIPDEFVKLQNLKMLFLDQNKLNEVCSTEITDFMENIDFYSIIQQNGYELKLNFYKSTDFSKDGEVRTLQTHTKGNGIKFIITMDAFSDRRINDGTVDSLIQMTYETLFSEEPYTTFKDYFDVYVVLAVSEREKISENIALGTIYSGEGYGIDYDKVETYARKVPALNDGITNNTHILVLLNDKSYYRASCGYCSYGSIACSNIRLEDDNMAKTIKHETLGHGIARLGDEYVEVVEPGMENPFAGNFPKEAWQNIWDEHQLGFRLNVDVTNDPTKIVWKDFLSNNDYVNEVGIYEGALLYEKGAYRATYESIMRHNTGGFNAPSRWAIYKKILEAAGETPTFVEFLEYDKKNLKKEQTITSRNVIEKTFDKRCLGTPPVFLNR